MFVMLLFLAQQPTDDQWGFDFGIGIVLHSDLDDDRIKSAEIINGIVIVTEEDSAQVKFVLEAHFVKKRFGPFIAIQPTLDGPPDSLGVGALWSVRDEKRAFNLGVGVTWDQSISVLADGFKDGQLAPQWWDGDEPLIVKRDGRGVMLLVSANF